MTTIFYQRYEQLCSERGLKPQTQEILSVLGVTSPTISGWRKGASPKIEAICSLANYFGVSSDYLLGLSELRNPSNMTLTDHEQLLIKAFRSADAQGQQNIIFSCQYELRKAKRGATVNAE